MKSDESQGLGDTIAKVTKATGIDRLVKAVWGEDCGCDERREKLNKMFPYGRTMNAEEKHIWETKLSDWENHRAITRQMQNLCLQLYNATSGRKKRFSRCGACVSTLFKETEIIYANSCEDEKAKNH